MDSLGFGIVFYLIVGIALWAALIAILAPRLGRRLKRNQPPLDTHGRERVGETPWEHYRRERELAVARGEVHAARARRRRLDAMERERDRGAA